MNTDNNQTEPGVPKASTHSPHSNKEQAEQSTQSGWQNLDYYA
jgi:hypothetical protein